MRLVNLYLSIVLLSGSAVAETIRVNPVHSYSISAGANSANSPDLSDIRVRNMGGTDARTRKAVVTFDLRDYPDALLSLVTNVSIRFELDGVGSLMGTENDTIRFYAILPSSEDLLTEDNSWDSLVTRDWHNASSAGIWNGSFLGQSARQTGALCGRPQHFSNAGLINMITQTLADTQVENMLVIGLASGTSGPLYNLNDDTGKFQLIFELPSVLKVSQDASIYMDNPGGNYGQNQNLQIRTTNGAAKAYIQFDASGRGMICGIRSLKMFQNHPDRTRASAYLLTGGNADEWNQDEITWNNAPGNDTSSPINFLINGTYTNLWLGESEKYVKNDIAWMEWRSSTPEKNKASLIHELNTGDRKATIAFCRKMPEKEVQFDSLEKGNVPIHLEVWTVSDSVFLIPQADASVYKADPDENYGSELFIRAQRDEPGTAKSYVRFDADGCGIITDIHFMSGVSLAQNGRSGRFYLITGEGADDWEESSITWNNAPGNDTENLKYFLNNGTWSILFLGRNEAVRSGFASDIEWEEGAKETLLNELNSGDRKITIGISHAGSDYLDLASRENSKGALRLCIQTAPESTVLTVSEDSYVSVNNPNESFGSESGVKAGKNGADHSKGYLKFAVDSGLVTGIESVEMVTMHAFNESADFYLLKGAGINDWSEGTITWNNAPANDRSSETDFLANESWSNVYLGQSGYTGQYCSTDLVWSYTNVQQTLVDALNSGDRKITLGISGTGDHEVELASKNNGIYPSVQIRLHKENHSPVDTALTDVQFFEKMNLDWPGLESVKSNYNSGNMTVAKHKLCEYYRNRAGTNFWWPGTYIKPSGEEGTNALSVYQQLLDQVGVFAQGNRRADGELDCRTLNGEDQRMTFMADLGRAYQYSGDEQITHEWIRLFRAWVDQMSLEDPFYEMNTLSASIRLYDSWGTSFICFINSPLFDDDTLFLFLKAFYEETEYVLKYGKTLSNWLTHQMLAVYSGTILFPEWAAVAEWRAQVLDTVILDLCTNGWLPDGVGIEMSLGYGRSFRNYLDMCDLAELTGNYVEPEMNTIRTSTENIYNMYLAIMAPGWKTPAWNDNHAAGVPGLMAEAVIYYPDRPDFIWGATKGAEGEEPDYLSVILPYSGYALIRSDWKITANALCFDAGPLGYDHAHQDKLSVGLWVYGRKILTDDGPPEYDNTAFENYVRDTYSHSTGLVDNRPQRRPWYDNPGPDHLPYQYAENFEYVVSSNYVWLSGEYTNAYGMTGGSYSNSAHGAVGKFWEGWVSVANHYRQIAYVNPDIFIVQDWFVPEDISNHTYEIRWQIDSTNINVMSSMNMETTDSNQPNLAIIPLRIYGGDLTAEAVSGQTDPDLMGWKPDTSEYALPCTTLRHIRSGTGSIGFTTLLLPLPIGSSSSGVTFDEANGVITLLTGDGRTFEITPAADPSDRLQVFSASDSDEDADGIPDWWERLYFGGPTNANATRLAANSVNTLREAYIAGVNPTNSASEFSAFSHCRDGRTIVSWNSVTGRLYTVSWSTNLLEGFVGSNCVENAESYTDILDTANKFYKVDVRLRL